MGVVDKEVMDSVQDRIGRRIVVVGTSGCGKTYVAQALAARLNIPYICNDALIWRANWVPTPADEKLKLFEEALAQPVWTFDGNIGSMRSPEDQLVGRRMDTLIWLDLPRREVWRRVFSRTVRRIRTRELLWHGNRETWRTAFLSNHSVIIWSLKSFNLRRRQYSTLFEDPSMNHVHRIRLRSGDEVNRWLAEIAPVVNKDLSNERNAHVGV